MGAKHLTPINYETARMLVDAKFKEEVPAIDLAELLKYQFGMAG
jgi:hypothetical protein